MRLFSPRRPRGFTLVELIVVILILGILAAVGIVGYTQVTGRANTAAATANLRQITTAALAAATEDGEVTLTRELVLEVMNAATGPAVVEGLEAAAWRLGLSGQSPDAPGEFALGFDDSTDSDVADDGSGLRAALVTATGDGELLAQVFTASGAGPIVPAESGVTPAVVLGAAPGGTVAPVLSDDGTVVPPPANLPDVTAVVATASAFTAEIVWQAVPGAAEYTVTATPEGSGAPVTASAATASVTLTGLTAGTTYSVVVVAAAPGKVSSTSTPVTMTTISAPTQPLLTATNVSGVPSVTWTTGGATSFTLERQTMTVGPALLTNPAHMATGPDGAVYVAETSAGKVRRIGPDGAVSTFLTGLNQPNGIAVRSDGVVYVADTGNMQVVEFSATGTRLRAFGKLQNNSFKDGAATVAMFYNPAGLALSPDGTVLYVADQINQRIRAINLATGNVSTYAGNGGTGCSNSARTSATFYFPTAVAVRPDGTVLVADTNNHAIRSISPAGSVSTLAGGCASYYSGKTDATGSAARFQNPTALSLAADGSVYVADSRNLVVRKVTAAGVTSTVPGFTGTSHIQGVLVTADGVLVAEGTTVTLVSSGTSNVVAGNPTKGGSTDSSTTTSPWQVAYEGEGTAFTDVAPPAGGSYRYRVTGSNAAGTGPASAPVTYR